MSAVVMEPGTGAAPPGARLVPPGTLEGGEQVVEPALVLLQLGQTLLRGPGGPAQLRQPAGAGLDQLGELGVLRLPLLASAIELLADVEQVVALLHHAVPRSFSTSPTRARSCRLVRYRYLYRLRRSPNDSAASRAWKV